MSEQKIKLAPWDVPAYVRAEFRKSISMTPEWPITEIDADALSSLCDEFRAEVFRKAGKADPNPPAGAPR